MSKDHLMTAYHTVYLDCAEEPELHDWNGGAVHRSNEAERPPSDLSRVLGGRGMAHVT